MELEERVQKLTILTSRKVQVLLYFTYQSITHLLRKETCHIKSWMQFYGNDGKLIDFVWYSFVMMGDDGVHTSRVSPDMQTLM